MLMSASTSMAPTSSRDAVRPPTRRFIGQGAAMSPTATWSGRKSTARSKSVMLVPVQEGRGSRSPDEHRLDGPAALGIRRGPVDVTERIGLHEVVEPEQARTIQLDEPGDELLRYGVTLDGPHQAATEEKRRDVDLGGGARGSGPDEHTRAALGQRVHRRPQDSRHPGRLDRVVDASGRHGPDPLGGAWVAEQRLGGTEVLGELEPLLVAVHGNDASAPGELGGQQRAQPNRADAVDDKVAAGPRTERIK